MFIVYLSNKALRIILRRTEFELHLVENWRSLKLFEKITEMINLYFSKNNQPVICKVN